MRDPDAQGPYGRAWLLQDTSGKPDYQANCGSWLVNCPSAHPFWHWWLVGLVSLRDIPGVKPAHKKYPEAEYEFMIYSIDPERCPNPEPDDPSGYPHLTPFDVLEQFHGVTDHDASRICMSAVHAIVNGVMSPDQDYRSAWKATLAATVQHFREGAHVES